MSMSNTTYEEKVNDARAEMSKAAYLKKMRTMFAETPGSMDVKKRATDLVRNANETGFDIYAEVNLDDIFADMTYQRDHKDRAKKISEVWDYKKCSPLIINIRADGTMPVIDGWTHACAAKEIGLEYLPARILCGLTVEEEAEIFASQGEGIVKPDPYDILKANLVYGEPIDTEIKRLCDKYGLKLEPNNLYKKKSSAGVVTCLTYLRETMTKKSGKEKRLNEKGRDAIDETFRLIKETSMDRYDKSHIRAMVQSASSLLMDDKYKDRDVYGILKENYLAEDVDPTTLIGYAKVIYPGVSDGAAMRSMVTDLVQEQYTIASLKTSIRAFRNHMA